MNYQPLGITANEMREDARRLEKILVFPESPQLVSLTEAANLCPGFGDEPCGDELDPGQELCPAHQRAENAFYDKRLWEQYGLEPFVAYPHLTD